MAKRTKAQKMAIFARVMDPDMGIAKYMDREWPEMGNKTPEALVDEIGDFKVMMDELEAKIKTLHTIVDSKLKPGQTLVKGDRYTMNLIPVTQRRLDGDSAKAVLAAIGKLDDCMKDLEFNQHKYNDTDG